MTDKNRKEKEIFYDPEEIQSDLYSWWRVITAITIMVLTCVDVWLIGENYGLLYACLFVPLLSGYIITCFVLGPHDCGHGSMFTTVRQNKIAGRMLGFFCLTPFYSWSREHNMHHAHFGKKQALGLGDLDTMTFEQYKNSSWTKRLIYRAMRTPLFALWLAPANWLIDMRLLTYDTKELYEFTTEQRNSRLMSTVFHIALLSGLYYISLNLFVVYCVSFYISMVIGMILFYVQHQHDSAHFGFKSNEDWYYPESSYYGSSYTKLPAVLEYLFTGINYHHIHHYDSSIPGYSLRKVHIDNDCENDPDLYVLDSFSKFIKCLTKNNVWDEDAESWITISETEHRRISNAR